MTQESEPHESGSAPLTTRETINLGLLVLCYAFLMSSVTLVVGTSAVVVISTGGSAKIAPLALAIFFAGSACISLVSHFVFRRGRKVGFLVGIGLGQLGAGLGAIGVWKASPSLVIGSCLLLGCWNGLGNYLRFAAVEVVSTSHRARAVTLVLTGGCLAAFAGPESSLATRDIFGPDLKYLGVFMMIGIFNTLNAVCLSLVQFPEPTSPEENTAKEKVAESLDERKAPSLFSLLLQRSFLVPNLTSVCIWTVMAMPMSIARVAMAETGFTSRQSLLTIELHFLGMFAPGFLTGRLLQQFGPVRILLWTVVVCCLGLGVDMAAGESEESAALATWMFGLILIGIGWNLGFSGSTVLLTQSITTATKARVQASNDFFMFFLSGAVISSTGYIYEGGGSGLQGWRLVNGVAFLVTGIMGLIVGYEIYCRKHEMKSNGSGDEQHTKGTDSKIDGEKSAEIRVDLEDLKPST